MVILGKGWVNKSGRNDKHKKSYDVSTSQLKENLRSHSFSEYESLNCFDNKKLRLWNISHGTTSLPSNLNGPTLLYQVCCDNGRNMKRMLWHCSIIQAYIKKLVSTKLLYKQRTVFAFMQEHIHWFPPCGQKR